MDDLFGHVPQKGELFAETQVYTPPIVHNTDTIRAEMDKLIAAARASAPNSWTPREARRNTAACLRFAAWLKNGEGDARIADYKIEIDRLGIPIEQVSPDWRERFGFDWKLGMEPFEIEMLERCR